MISLCVVHLTCRIVEASVELLPVVEDALQFLARRCSVRELHLPHILAGHSVHRHHTIMVPPLEAAHIVDVIADRLDPLDQKLAHLKDQTAIVRPFYLPKMRNDWDESDVNCFKDVDFDYAAILGYGPGEDGGLKLTSLYFLPTDTLLDVRAPDEDGVWRDLRLASHFVSQMSLNPRQKYAKFLYLAERMSEGLEYQFDKYGYFFSNR